jgi:HD-GYP domain-containing protein (c-di-GMP phosphodiesterase class II)
MHALPVRASLYIGAVVLAAGALLTWAAVAVDWASQGAQILVLALLYLLANGLSARESADRASITLGSIIALASIPLVGLAGATIVAAVPAMGTRGTPHIKRAFNTGQWVVCVAAAAAAYELVGGVPISQARFPSSLLPVLVADVTVCLVNAILVAEVMHLTQRAARRAVWQGTFARQMAAYLAYGLFGLLLAVLWDGLGIGPLSALLLLLPLYIARWAYAQYAEEQHAYDRTVRTLIAAVETKDLYTRGHSERVATASVLIARAMKLRDDRVASLRYAGMLHDVGKLGVPTRVLQKSTRLTEEEFAAIQLHPVRGLEMVREIEFLDEAFAGIMHHHERLDGQGYPMGLKGDQIPEFARMIAVADAFDSMTTTRSYRGARTIEEAVAELRRCAGTQFQPEMVEALVAALDEHGWQVETAPMFEPVVELVQPATSAPASFDHDDPTMAPIPRQAVT